VRATPGYHFLRIGHPQAGGNGWIWQNGAFSHIDPAPLVLVSTVADNSENGVLPGETTGLDFKTHGYIGWPTR
jgi:hypothetical protein